MLLWEEYRAGQPEGYGYSRFCDLHAAWRGRLSPTMRQTHPAGERMFVDYAGQTVDVIDGATGEVRRAQVFVAVLGASNFTYAEARWTQSLPDWIGCHVGAFANFGGAARQIVCDNLKAGVTATSRYEPGISRTYQDMATHYGTAILPARVRRPRDTAKVEVAVQVVQRCRVPSRERDGCPGSGPAASSAVFLSGGAERRHPRTDRRPQRPADAPSRHDPARPVRGDRA